MNYNTDPDMDLMKQMKIELYVLILLTFGEYGILIWTLVLTRNLKTDLELDDKKVNNSTTPLLD